MIKEVKVTDPSSAVHNLCVMLNKLRVIDADDAFLRKISLQMCSFTNQLHSPGSTTFPMRMRDKLPYKALQTRWWVDL